MQNIKKLKLLSLYSILKFKTLINTSIKLKLLRFNKIKIIAIITNTLHNQINYVIISKKFYLENKIDGIEFLYRNSLENKLNLKILMFLLLQDIRIYYKQLILRGNGFKIFFLTKLNQINFKIGYSHKKHILLPWNTMKVIIQKFLLIVLDFNSSRLGNFLAKIRKFKTSNAFTGRGFSYFKHKQKLKLIKK